jgi:hypothetical protein
MLTLCQKSGCSIVIGEINQHFLFWRVFDVLQQTSKSGTPHAWKSPEKGARRRVSRVLSRPEALVLGRGWPFLWGARCRAPRATDPSGGAKVRPAFPRAGCLPLLLGLAPGGVFPAAAVAGGAVRSYRTVSPLPPARCSGTDGGVLSVALSLGSPPPGVTRHRTSVEPGLSSLRPKAESGHPTVWH